MRETNGRGGTRRAAHWAAPTQLRKLLPSPRGGSVRPGLPRLQGIRTQRRSPPVAGHFGWRPSRLRPGEGTTHRSDVAYFVDGTGRECSELTNKGVPFLGPLRRSRGTGGSAASRVPRATSGPPPTSLGTKGRSEGASMDTGGASSGRAPGRRRPSRESPGPTAFQGAPARS